MTANGLKTLQLHHLFTPGLSYLLPLELPPIVPEITPASTWTLRNDNINFPLASTAPSLIPSGNLPANHPLGDFVSEGVTQNSSVLRLANVAHQTMVPANSLYL